MEEHHLVCVTGMVLFALGYKILQGELYELAEADSKFREGDGK